MRIDGGDWQKVNSIIKVAEKKKAARKVTAKKKFSAKRKDVIESRFILKEAVTSLFFVSCLNYTGL